MSSRFFLLSFLLSTLLACGPTPLELPKPSLSVKIDKTEVSPGDTLTLDITLKNFTLMIDKIGQPPAPAEGHFRIYLDDAKGKDFLPQNPSSFQKITLPTTLTPGAHSLRISLFQNDGNPLSPPIEQIVSFKIKEEVIIPPPPPPKKPSLLASTQTTSLAPGESLSLSLTVEHFALKKPSANPLNQKGEGHLRVYLDDNSTPPILTTENTNPTLTLPTNTPPGTHTLIIALVQNNGDPLSPPVQQTLPLKLTAPSPTIKLTLDRNTVTAGEKITLTLALQHFSLAPSLIGKPNQSGKGHTRITLDSLDNKTFVENALSYFIYTVPKDTKAGKHKLFVKLMNNDRTPLKPDVSSSIEFDVTPTTPTTAISAVARPTTLAAGKPLTLTITVTDFKLVPVQTKPTNKPGEGHYHIYLDNKTGKDTLAIDAKTSLNVTIPANTPPGNHTLRIQLMNNDHTPLSPTTQTTVLFNITTPLAACTPSFQTNTNCKAFVDRSAATASRVINFPTQAYNPKCIKIKVGQELEYKGSFTAHPLKQVCGPLASIPDTTSGTSKKIKFTKAGLYGYYCTRHARVTGTGMAGMIQVVP